MGDLGVEGEWGVSIYDAMGMGWEYGMEMEGLKGRLRMRMFGRIRVCVGIGT